MAGTFWAFVPAIVAIVLALLTKQVYLSLFCGIFVGAMFIANGNPVEAFGNMFITMANQLGENGGILIFLVVLGIFAILMVKSGGSQAYGEWATSKIKTKTGAQLSTIALGALIFVDDYFNCLTVGSAMRPVTDKFKISHAKLAYLIDSTAAPVCIIAPISSWAAAVSGFIEGSDGLMDFIKTIPLNLYALLTLGMMIAFAVLKIDLFKMRKNETAAESGDLYAGEFDLPTEDIQLDTIKNGKIINMVFPIVTLIVCCVGAMIYNGFFFDWDAGILTLTPQSGNILEAFSNCDAGSSLAMGSIIALLITLAYYMIAKVLSFSESMKSITEGFKSMVPAILILAFAWTLCYIMGAKGQDNSLDARAFIREMFGYDADTGTVNTTMAFGILPAIFFLLACGISFATGTSWGTFGTLIPIALCILGNGNDALLYLSMSATLAGAVYGDHVSPISDTTIMASSGAQCNHIDHVRTQMPYASIVAVVCFVSYLISGLVSALEIGYGFTVLVTLASGAILLAIVIIVFRILDNKGLLGKNTASQIISEPEETVSEPDA
ncbi:MAG: Na+/H+ antiporter NhaC family protein [Clostridia bacterium]|nr:Na+/H+ antiporter NhaC family protein [Clostridia bacterium]